MAFMLFVSKSLFGAFSDHEEHEDLIHITKSMRNGIRVIPFMVSYIGKGGMPGLLSVMYHSRNSTSIGEHFDYVFSETLINFSMAGYGLAHTAYLVLIPIVSASMANQSATPLFKSSNEVFSIHQTAMSS